MKINFKKLITIILVTFLVGGIFSFFTINNDTYQNLIKPFEIPTIVFPIVWSIIYLLISISYYLVSGNKKTLKIYALQLVINSLWTLIFFGLNMYLFAFFWLLLLLGVVIYMTVEFYKIDKRTLYLNIPYILWLLFAGYLNLSIYLLNR